MKVRCTACGVTHDVSPPPWVVASGRPFDLQCPACGHVQKVRPSTGLGAPQERPVVADPQPSPPPAAPALPAQTADAAEPPVVPPIELPVVAPSAGVDLADDDPFDADFEDSYHSATRMADATIVDTPAWAGQALAPTSTLKLRMEGDVFEVDDIATLQRWVLEHRVTPDDQVDEGDGNWIRAGDHPALQAAFETFHRLDAEHVTADDLTTGDVEPHDDATVESARPPTEEMMRGAVTEEFERSSSIDPIPGPPPPSGPVVARPPPVRITATNSSRRQGGSGALWLVGALVFTVTAFGVFRYSQVTDDTAMIVLPAAPKAEVAAAVRLPPAPPTEAPSSLPAAAEVPVPARPSAPTRRIGNPMEEGARAREAVRVGDAARAIAGLQEALVEWPEDPRLLHALGEAHLALKDPEGARKALCAAMLAAEDRRAIQETLKAAKLSCTGARP